MNKILWFFCVAITLFSCSHPPPEGALKLESLRIWADEAEVTSREFKEFVEYYDLELASDSLSAQIFDRDSLAWKPTDNASFLNPTGEYPVDTLQPAVHVNWHEACAYCNAKKGRLPTAEEWLKLASGDYLPGNIWEGFYPFKDEGKDGFVYSVAPIKSFKPNTLGLFDMYGNVREWTLTKDSLGYAIVKGGSFLTDYNSGAFIPEYSERMSLTELREDLGFRCVYDF